MYMYMYVCVFSSYNVSYALLCPEISLKTSVVKQNKSMTELLLCNPNVKCRRTVQEGGKKGMIMYATVNWFIKGLNKCSLHPLPDSVVLMHDNFRMLI